MTTNSDSVGVRSLAYSLHFISMSLGAGIVWHTIPLTPGLYQKRPPLPHSHSHSSTPSGTASPYHFNPHQTHPHPGTAGSRTDTPPVIGVPPPSPATKGSGQHGHHQAPPHSQAHLPTHPNAQTHYPSRLSMSVSITEHEASARSLIVALICGALPSALPPRPLLTLKGLLRLPLQAQTRRLFCMRFPTHLTCIFIPTIITTIISISIINRPWYRSRRYLRAQSARRRRAVQ